MTGIAFDNSYARLPEGFAIKTDPAPASAPQLLALNTDLAGDLGLDVTWLQSADGLDMLSGRQLPDTAEPIAMAYAGHQFGGWSHQLGDGRAHLLGEFLGRDGIRRDLQLKGSGRTPFSRNGDGKSALGPVLREYIVSEFMAACGVPTTRALAAVATGDRVQREVAQPGGVLTRIAQSHVRVGTFQYFYAREWNDKLRVLADYVIDRHYPAARDTDNPVLALLEGMAARQASLIAHWMSLGFIHGVMNTDNMQIAGETIDYGPCAFMDAFHPQKVFSSIDTGGRYSWGNQPNIGVWNLSRLGEALIPLLHEDQDQAVTLAQGAVEQFGPAFNRHLVDRFAAKLGVSAEQLQESDLVNNTLKVMVDNGVDFTLFFRHLTQLAKGGEADALLGLFIDQQAGKDWLALWQDVFDNDRVQDMTQANPVFIPRNHRVEEAIASGLSGDFAPFKTLNEVLKNPFQEQPDFAYLESAPSEDEIVHQTFCGT